MNVELFHLLSGEDVIGEVPENSTVPGSPMILVKNACVLMMTQNPKNPEQVAIQLRPVCPFTAEKEIHLNLSLVVYRVKPVKDLEDQFKQAFGGIIIAPAGAVPAVGMAGAPNLTRIK